MMKFKWDGKLIKGIEKLLDLVVIIFSIYIGFISGYLLKGDTLTEANNVLMNNLSSVPFILFVVLYIISIIIFFSFLKVTVINKTFFSVVVSLFMSLFITNILFILLNLMLKQFIATALIYSFIHQFIIFLIIKFILFKVIQFKTKSDCMIFGNEKDMKNYLIKFANNLPKNRTIKYIIFEENNGIDFALENLKNIQLVYLLPNISKSNKDILMKRCIAENDVDVCLIPNVYDVSIAKVSLETIDDSLVYKVKSLHISKEEEFIKRVMDIIFSFLAIIVFIPFFIIIGIVIKLFDKGSIIYKQERVTKNGKKFMMYKFRTMKENCEEESGAIWAVEDDSRVTFIGKILRKLRLDELPQLWNVLKGDMSFVGPRPERPIFVEQFEKENPEFRYRLNAKAGITGYAQVFGRYNTKPIDKLRFDLYYIRNYSILLDFKLMLLTIKTVFDKEASRGVSEDISINDVLKYFPKAQIVNMKNINMSNTMEK